MLAAALVLVAILAACSGDGSQGGEQSAGEAIFVSLPAADAVGKFDAETGEVLRQATVGMLPHNLLLSKDGSKLYAALVGSQAIAELDVASGDLLRTFLTEPVPERDEDDTVIQAHIDQDAFSKTSCFACHDGSGTAQPAVVGTRPIGLVLSAEGETLYVANIRSANLSVIDLSTGKLDRLLHLEPNGVAHEPTALALLGDQLFVSLLPTLPTLEPHPPAVVRRLDLDTFTPLSDTSTGRNAAILLADDSRGRVYVSNVETDTLSLFDADACVFSVLLVAAVLVACSSGGPPADGGSSGGTGSINGLVTDSSTGSRLSGVAVTVAGKSATTNSAGEFTVTNLAAGEAKLSFAKDGYAPGYDNAVISDGPTPVLVTLKKQGDLQAYD